MGKGTIHIYIPEETGETAAAYGRALLDAAGGKKVVVIRFIKDKANCNSDFFKKMEPEMRLFSFEDIRNGINYARKVLATEECDLLLLTGLLELVNAEHITVADLKIILDVVFNHTGNFGEANLFPMFEKDGDLGDYSCVKQVKESPLPSNYDSMNGSKQYEERIAAMKNTRNDGSDPNYIYHHYGNFSWESFGGQVAQIAGDCVDLNTENPVVAEYLVKSYGEFIKMGVDAFRIDTMKHISRLTLNNYIFPALYEFARKCGNENFYMFGEVCTRDNGNVWYR